MAEKRDEILRGTLDLLILSAFSEGPLHGHAIARCIHERSDEVLVVEEGTLYPALHRLEGAGQLKAKWGRSENNRRARFYTLTAKGLRRLRDETEGWRRVSRAVGQVVEAGVLS